MDSPLRRALVALANRQSLAENQTAEVFGFVMSGELTLSLGFETFTLQPRAMRSNM